MQDAASYSVRGASLANRPFRLLWSGHTISSLGDWVATFGLMLYVRDLTHGSDIEGLAISGILGFRILPALIAAPIASGIADRFDRRRTMVATDIVRAGLIAIVPFTPNLAAVYGVAFLLEGFSLVFLPARDAVIPEIVDEDSLAGANALVMLSQWGTIPIAGGLVVAADAASRAIADAPVIGPLARQRFALPFFFDSITFLVSALAIAALPVAVGRVARARPASSDDPFGAGRNDIAEGVRFLLTHRGPRDMLIGMALATGAGGALFSLGIPYVKTTLGGSDSVFGALIALWGAGMAAGAWLSQRAAGREAEFFRIALGGCGAILIVMAALPYVWLALIVAVGFGAGLSVAMVLGITAAQRSAPEGSRGRVMAAVHVLARICLIGGAVVVGGVAAASSNVRLLPGWDGNRYAFVLAGTTMILGGLAAKGGALILAEERDLDGAVDPPPTV